MMMMGQCTVRSMPPGEQTLIIDKICHRNTRRENSFSRQ